MVLKYIRQEIPCLQLIPIVKDVKVAAGPMLWTTKTMFRASPTVWWIDLALAGCEQIPQDVTNVSHPSKLWTVNWWWGWISGWQSCQRYVRSSQRRAIGPPPPSLAYVASPLQAKYTLRAAKFCSRLCNRGIHRETSGKMSKYLVLSEDLWFC
jgi:hypothetical protein